MKYNKGGVESEVQIWDLTPESLKEELKPTLERMLGVSIDQLWGIQALPLVDQHLILALDIEDVATEMLHEVNSRTNSSTDEFGIVYSDEHFITSPRGSSITPQGKNMSGGLYMRLGKLFLEKGVKLFIENRCTIRPEFSDTRIIEGETVSDVAKCMQGVVEYVFNRMEAH